MSGKENTFMDDAFKTPSRRKEPSMQDILRHDHLSPLKPKTPSNTHVSTPIPKSNKGLSVADLFQSQEDLQKKNQMKAPLPPLFSETSLPSTPSQNQRSDSLQSEAAALRAQLENEKQARQEAERKLAEFSKMGSNQQLMLQKQEEMTVKMEKELREEKVASANLRFSLQEMEKSFTSTLSKEKDARKRAEEELSRTIQNWRDDNQKGMQQIGELEALRRQVTQLSSLREKQEGDLTEKEKARQRRSIGFHEEQKVRIQLEQELDDLQISHDEMKEKFQTTIALLEKSLAMEKEKSNFLESKLDLASKEVHQEKKKTEEILEHAKYVKAENLVLEKTILELRKQLFTSYNALEILEAKCAIDSRKSAKELEMTNEQLEILRAAAFQANCHLTQTNAAFSQEKKGRAGAEEKLASQAKISAELEEKLKIQSSDVIPFMQYQLTQNQSQMKELSDQIVSFKNRSVAIEQELIAERKARIEVISALSHETEQRKTFERVAREIQEKAEREIRREKQERLKVEQELSLHLTTYKKI